MLPIFKHLPRKASSLISRKGRHLGGVLKCLLLKKFFGLRLGAVSVEKAHAEEVLLRI